MRLHSIRVAAACSVALGQIAAADPVDVPNVFTSGGTARAADVNQNFAVIEAAINDNDSRIEALESAGPGQPGGVAVFDGSGNQIGLLVTGITTYDAPTRISVVNEQGYTFTLSMGSGEIYQPGDQTMARVYYATQNCTGQPYAGVASGVVFRSSPGAVLYYTDRNSAAVPVTNGSVTNWTGQCLSAQLEYAWPLLPNNPTITGVSGQPHALPIKIGRP
jgi:hypothetical protein